MREEDGKGKGEREEKEMEKEGERRDGEEGKGGGKCQVRMTAGKKIKERKIEEKNI